MRFVSVFLVLALAVGACGAGDTGRQVTSTSTSTTTPVETTTTGTSATSTTAVTTTTQPLTTTTAQAYDVIIEGGNEEVPEVTVQGPDSFEASLGETVSITVLPSFADEIHVHGYDLFFDAEEGVPVTIEFVADVPGIFEVELESSHLLLFELEVTP